MAKEYDQAAAFITREANRLGMSKREFIILLVAFYRLEHLDLLIKQLGSLIRSGPNHVQLVQLSALHTFMQHAKERLCFK